MRSVREELNERLLSMEVGEEIHMLVGSDGSFILDPENVRTEA